MALNLETMSLDELGDLRKQVDAAIKGFEKRRKKEALAAAQKAAQEFGFSLEDVLGSGKKGGAKGAPKYANPADPAQTWTGRGRQPGWVKDALAAGKSLDDFAI